MTKNDFLSIFSEYIDTLLFSDLNDEELKTWIISEAEEQKQPLTFYEIGWIIEEVRKREKD